MCADTRDHWRRVACAAADPAWTSTRERTRLAASAGGVGETRRSWRRAPSGLPQLAQRPDRAMQDRADVRHAEPGDACDELMPEVGAVAKRDQLTLPLRKRG